MVNEARPIVEAKWLREQGEVLVLTSNGRSLTFKPAVAKIVGLAATVDEVTQRLRANREDVAMVLGLIMADVERGADDGS